jgi:hypothetical protein
MKKILLPTLLLAIAHVSPAQSGKQVQWSYAARKIADKTYEVHMIANINGGYHLYAQDVDGESTAATTFTFTKNPLINLDGRVRENGKAINKFETALKHVVKYYEKNVDFIQVVKLTGNVKTSLTGKVEFEVCNETHCLPPSEVEINVKIGG